MKKVLQIIVFWNGQVTFSYLISGTGITWLTRIIFLSGVMLIKAWCHYECRILGAFHGLLATYALEALILFIFQLFNSSLNGLLDCVLYRFLDYYANFDWKNCCISLEGQVLTSSLPNLVVTNQGNGRA
ncbi:uncharacterized protein LOC108213879 [Daucus carota subsp. sativus]|uniref:uncharacterized protein LOC108213879 n=1 Tax=Daucus carota subsp. sativus TaxID=79200 RepID=UPI0007F03EB0|nr:PREDICTED: uncharacterized protein LOC108213879 [Daucus carota subsp. sativus]XP_017241158.1 PREDICTED: uncharacterized protein LOC108213879 [Daucus carota subsp. sativus]